MRPREIAARRAPSSWLSTVGAEGDVVLTSRARLARNLADYPYPPVQSAESGEETDMIIAGALLSELDGLSGLAGQHLSDLRPSDLGETERSYLSERRIVGRSEPRRIAVSPDESLVFQIGTTDHLRMISYEPGLASRRSLERLQQIDAALEKTLHFAVAIDWGYLSTEVGNLGTAMRGSLLVHLPALVEVGRMDEVVRSVHNTGFDLTPDEGLNPTTLSGSREKQHGGIHANLR